ncbi:DUF4287 domain-containing protein [Deinococcus sp. Arct2-2]|uniref:DUF4287 domain-containing protein n=1 Tax=Deinococcus sp. Arct2-2 TaxID=2568653 RepID=UPI0010A2EF36|nr:DUF4287 domain-containing protein [Deinococcus sp. Arct2-2]THF68768.1 DUF4287 domain-containing protein [Deinococcus sp. Arct2-2]
MAKTPEQIKQSYYTNIAAKTSINIPDWMARIRAKLQAGELARHSDIVNWLKAEHSLGHGHATLLAHDAMKAEEAG